jgi:uncharacterized protein (TIGR00106 family)
VSVVKNLRRKTNDCTIVRISHRAWHKPGALCPKGVSVIHQSGFKYEVGGMSTSVEVPDLDALFDLVKKVHAAHLSEGAQRVIIDLKVDDRRDKQSSIQLKKSSATKETD